MLAATFWVGKDIFDCLAFKISEPPRGTTLFETPDDITKGNTDELTSVGVHRKVLDDAESEVNMSRHDDIPAKTDIAVEFVCAHSTKASIDETAERCQFGASIADGVRKGWVTLAAKTGVEAARKLQEWARNEVSFQIWKDATGGKDATGKMDASGWMDATGGMDASG